MANKNRQLKTFYNEQVHIEMLDDVLSNGGLPIEFCMRANICQTTLNTWLITYPDFKHAYDVFMVRAEVAWMNNVKLATTAFRYWYFVMSNVFGFDNLNLFEPCQEMTAKELSDKLIEGISDGRFTHVQIEKLNAIISERFKLEKSDTSNELTNFKNSLEEITKDDLSNKKRPVDQPIEVVDNQLQKLSKVASL
jgi:hypothetical protein